MPCRSEYFLFAKCANKAQEMLGSSMGSCDSRLRIRILRRSAKDDDTGGGAHGNHYGLQLLRVVQFKGTVAWFTDSMYALGIMLHAHAASTKTALVARARSEAREALLRYRLTGAHTPAHIGNPPNECALPD